MNELEKKKVLFVSPKYSNYYKFIIEELIKRNNEVVFIAEEEEYIKFDWLLSKFSGSYKRYYLNKVFKKIILRLKNNFDYIFVIRGRWIDQKTINHLKINNPQAKLLMYQWDSTLSNPNIIKIAQLFNKVFSFDYFDCEKHSNFIYLPLFYIKHNSNDSFSKNKVIYDLVFLGSSHSDRIEILEKTKAGLNAKYNFKILLSTSPIKYIKSKFIKKELLHLKKEDFIFKHLNYQDYLSLILQTDAVLDFEHPDQSGLTIRTFEVLAMGKKLITTNHNIKNEPFYDDRIISVIYRINPKIPAGFLRNKCDINIDFSSYSISNWVSKIFDI